MFYYFLVWGLDLIGKFEKDIMVVNMLDVDMIVVYNMSDVIVVVIWNLFVVEIFDIFGVIKVFDLLEIFGEIIDFIGVNIDVFNDNLVFGKVFVGVWYEIMFIMVFDMDEGKVVRVVMGEVLGMDFEGYEF